MVLNLLNLPDLCLEHIFSFMSYDEISKKRIICKRINNLNQRFLNRGFVQMTKKHSSLMKSIKAQLPRRESERRNHPLSKHSDILTCIETRISMLSMTYTKYMDLDLCCFIPGRVIDEVLSILKLVGRTSGACTQLRAHEVLQELRDISSMATDHFDDEIAPILKQRYLNTSQMGSTSSATSTPVRDRSFSYLDRSLSEKLVGFQDSSTSSEKTCEEPHGCKLARMNRNYILKLQNSYKIALKKARSMVLLQTKQMLQIKTYNLEMSTMKSQMTDLKKRLEEYEEKNREMAATISQMKASQDNTSEVASTSSRTRNIKPRSATIILKRRIDEQSYTTSTLNEVLKKQKIDE